MLNHTLYFRSYLSSLTFYSDFIYMCTSQKYKWPQWPAGCLSLNYLTLNEFWSSTSVCTWLRQNSVSILLSSGHVRPHTICEGGRQDWRRLLRQIIGAVKILEIMTELTEPAGITTAFSSSQNRAESADDSVIYSRESRINREIERIMLLKIFCESILWVKFWIIHELCSNTPCITVCTLHVIIIHLIWSSPKSINCYHITVFFPN